MTGANQYAPATTSTGFRCRSGRSKLLPPEIGVQAIKPSPYRTGPSTPRLRHLSPAVGFLACSCPLHLSDPGKPSDPADLPSSLSHLRWGCDRAPRGALVALGHCERTVYRRCLEGRPWQRVLPGIVMLFTGHPTADQLVHAALLLAGPDAVVTGIEACRRHGLSRRPGRRVDDGNGRCEVHVPIPKPRQVRSVEFVHVERTERLPAPVLRGGVPLAPLVRSCTDAARRLRSAAEITELLSEPVQRRLCTVNMLSEELHAGSRRGTAIPRAVLADVADGVRSAAERAAKQFWPSTGLPNPWWNASIRTAGGEFLGVGDCWIDEVAMLWEIESS